MSNCRENVIFLEKVPSDILENLHKELHSWDFKNDRFHRNRVFEMHKTKNFKVSKYSLQNSYYSENINSAVQWVSKFYPNKKPFWSLFIAMYPSQRYPVHQDGLRFHSLCNRIHIPLVTDTEVSMVFFKKNQNTWETEKHHLSINNAWEINNLVPHSAENLSNNWRIHFIIDLIDPEYLEASQNLLDKVIPDFETFKLDSEFQKDLNLKKWTLSEVTKNFDKFNSLIEK